MMTTGINKKIYVLGFVFDNSGQLARTEVMNRMSIVLSEEVIVILGENLIFLSDWIPMKRAWITGIEISTAMYQILSFINLMWIDVTSGCLFSWLMA